MTRASADPQAEDSALWVNGRRYLINVDTAELERASAQNMVCEGVLGDVLHRLLLRFATTVSATSAVGGSLAQCNRLVHQARTLGRELQGSLGTMSADLLDSAVAYLRAEQANMIPAGGLDSLRWLLGNGPAILGMAASITRGRPEGISPAEGYTRLLKALDALAGTDPAGAAPGTGIRTSPLVQPDPRSGALSTIRGNLAVVGEAYSGDAQRSFPQSSIIVDRMKRTDGSYAVVVSVPGTQSWFPYDGPGVNDNKGSVTGLMQARNRPASTLSATAVAQKPNAEQAIILALRKSGVSAADHLILNGHSQGAIHVAALASDPAFVKEFGLRAINVAGGPIGQFNIERSVSVLAVENINDPVPALGGARNRITDRHTTVITGKLPGSTPGDLRAAANAHAINSYVGSAARIDVSTAPAVQRHLAVLKDTAGPSVLARDAQGRVIGDRTLVSAQEKTRPGRSAKQSPRGDGEP